MTSQLLPVIPRRRAYQEIDRAIAELLSEANAQVAERFVDAIQRAFAHLARFPSSGSTRYGLALRLPGLRTWRARPFPYLIFYVDRPDAIDVWCVLHERRDLPASIVDEAGAG